MPELPEVETIRLELASKLKGKIVTEVIFRRLNLRWPISQEIKFLLPGKQILDIHRRAKYLLIYFSIGSIILHLGMSGHIKIISSCVPAGKHDHVDINLDSNQTIRFNDTRRFGCLLWQSKGETHELLKNLGVEPLSCDFNEKYLFERSRKRKTSIKAFLMNQNIVVGIGNIYATELLFKAGVLPSKEAGSITYHDCVAIIKATKDILTTAIVHGGTTFRDYARSDGQPGTFKEELFVYGRSGKSCLICGHILRSNKLSNRTTVWCGYCQK